MGTAWVQPGGAMTFSTVFHELAMLMLADVIGVMALKLRQPLINGYIVGPVALATGLGPNLLQHNLHLQAAFRHEGDRLTARPDRRNYWWCRSLP